MSEKILITGAAGEIGTMLRSGLQRPGRSLRLVDVAELAAATPGEDVELITASVTDQAAMRRALEGVDAVVHLAGLLGGATWDDYLNVNIHGTFVVLEAARAAGVKRVVYASSHHATGFHPRSDVTAPDYLFPRPDSLYGVSKVAGEALASLYHDRHDLDVVCLRIASYRSKPSDRRALAQWLSPGDCLRLVEAALSAPRTGFRVLWGVSNNTRNWLSLIEGNSLGYWPQDDAETFVGEVLAATADDVSYQSFDETYLGGAFCRPDVDSQSRT